jgi:hypothetical protein
MEWFGNAFFAAVMGIGLLLNAVGGDALPEPVAKALAQRLPGMEVAEIDRDRDAGRVVYELTLRDDARVLEADFGVDGAFLGSEEEIAWKEVPAEVRQQLNKSHPDVAAPAEITRYVRPREGKERTTYVLEFQARGRGHEMSVEAQGHVNYDRLD